MELKRYKLGEVAKVEISGVDKKTKDGETPVRLCNFTDVYYNWAITQDMAPNLMKASANPNEISRFSLRKGQVAFTKDSETRDDIGIAAYIADDFDNVILGYHCALITPDESKVIGAYINAFMHTSLIQTYFSNNASGSGQRYSLSVETMERMPLFLPSLEEQKRVADLFSNIDKKIAFNRQINANLEALAKQLYDYWFVQFDFPDANGKPYKSSGGKMVYNEKLKREIPDGWEVKSINQISSLCRGVSYAKDDLLNEGGILVLRGNNIENNKLVYDANVAFVPDNLVSSDQHLYKGDIVMTMSSGSKEHIGKCIYFYQDSEHTFGAFLSKITPARKYTQMVFLFFCSNFYKVKIKSICSGTGINNLTNQTFDNIYLVIPDEHTLEKFNVIIEPIFDATGNNESEISSLTKQRDELLPLLMNGQVII